MWQRKKKKKKQARREENSKQVEQFHLLIVQVDEMYRWDVKNFTKRPIQQHHCVKMLSDMPGR